MENKSIVNTLLNQVSNFGWWLYVRIAWRRNKSIQRKLDADTRDNLGFYLKK